MVGRKTEKYLSELKLFFDEQGSKTESALCKIMPRKQAEKLLDDFFYAIYNYDPQKIYDIKNSNFDASLILSGAYDLYIYQRIGAWIEENLYLFKGDILDVGCDNGIMTCLLAKLLPNSKITAIDINSNSIKCAKALAKKMHINNVDFICCSMESLENHKYDTIFEMRILHENINTKRGESFFMNLEEKVSHFKNECYKLVNNTASLLNENGNFISVIRCDMNELFLGYIAQMNEHDLYVDFKKHKEFKIKEPERFNNFQVLVANKNNKQENMYDYLIENENYKMNRPKSFELEGDIKLSKMKKELLAGINVYDEIGHCMKYALYSSKEPTSIHIELKSHLHYEDSVATYDISETTAGIREIERVAKDYIEQGKKVINMKTGLPFIVK